MWLGGNGAVGIFNLMEDTATAEIARSQVWQWLHNNIVLEDGSMVMTGPVQRVLDDVASNIRALFGDDYDERRFAEAREFFVRVTTSSSLLCPRRTAFRRRYVVFESSTNELFSTCRPPNGSSSLLLSQIPVSPERSSRRPFASP